MPPQNPRRDSLRYPWHDYAEPGTVFVTLCTERRQRLFGQVEAGEMVLSPAGETARTMWQQIPERFASVDIDAFVVMPDHIHGLIMTGIDPAIADPSATVGAVIRWFKSSVVEAYRLGVVNQGWPRYDVGLFQRSFHDRIVRSDAEFANRRRYIEGNPGRWWEKYGDGS